MAFNIADLFEAAVDAMGERLALVVGAERRSFDELEAAANRAAHHLRLLGVGPGDLVGLFARNSAAHVELLLGAFKLRAVPVNLNYRYTSDELVYLLADAEPAAVLADADLGDVAARTAASTGASAVLATIGTGSEDYPATAAGEPPTRDFEPRSGDDLYICYTGGTTGMPKGVVWRHEDVIFALGGGFDAYTGEPIPHDRFLAERAAAGEAPRLVSLTLPPLMHGAGQWGTLRFLFEANAVVLQPSFDPHEAWRLVERERVTNITMTGDAMARPLLDALEELTDGSELDLSSLFVIASTGAVLSPSLKRALLDRFPGALLIDSVGSTETGQNGMGIVSREDADAPASGPTVASSPDSVVVDDQLRPVQPGSGAVGRLARRGHVPLRYHNDPVKSAATFVTAADGTRLALGGDSVKVEADGSFTLLGRDSVCINSGGEKVFTEEVEAVLKEHPDVYDAVVVGVPDERWGQRVAAVVAPRPGSRPSLDELASHCRGHLAGYKIPRQLHLVGEVQRSDAGKPDYRWASEMAAR